MTTLHAIKADQTDELEPLEGFELMELETPPAVWGPHTLVNTGPLNREVLISGEIDASVANAICSQIAALDEIAPEAPIMVRINTPGGDVTQALAIYDTMRSVRSPIITLVQGAAHSAGLLLLQGGDLRIMFPNSTLFYHAPIAGAAAATPAMMKDAFDSYQWAYTKMDDIIRKRARISKRAWKKRFTDQLTAVTIYAPEALELKLVDHTIEYLKKPKLQLN